MHPSRDFLLPIRKLLGPTPMATPADQAEMILELAYLMTVADGRLAERELAAFRAAMETFGGRTVTEAELVELLDRFAGPAHLPEVATRVREVAPTLAREHRELAFKLAIGLALVDGEAHDDENDLVSVLFEALALEPGRADALAGEVRAVFATV